MTEPRKASDRSPSDADPPEDAPNVQRLRDLDIPETNGVDFDDAPGLNNPWSKAPDDNDDED
jgi:hypothetical protein